MIKRLLPLALLALLPACATVSHPTNECRFSIIKGAARYGTFTQYVSGDGTTVRVVVEGTGCPGVKLRIVDLKTGVVLDYFWDEEDAEHNDTAGN